MHSSIRLQGRLTAATRRCAQVAIPEFAAGAMENWGACSAACLPHQTAACRRPCGTSPSMDAAHLVLAQANPDAASCHPSQHTTPPHTLPNPFLALCTSLGRARAVSLNLTPPAPAPPCRPGDVPRGGPADRRPVLRLPAAAARGRGCDSRTGPPVVRQPGHDGVVRAGQRDMPEMPSSQPCAAGSKATLANR